VGDLSGYRIEVLYEAGGEIRMDWLNNVAADGLDDILREWRRPWWRRSTRELRMVALDRGGEEIRVAWRHVRDIRVQPQLEAIA
jgi:hypothetical protein